jgi:hypothetical protein
MLTTSTQTNTFRSMGRAPFHTPSLTTFVSKSALLVVGRSPEINAQVCCSLPNVYVTSCMPSWSILNKRAGPWLRRPAYAARNQHVCTHAVRGQVDHAAKARDASLILDHDGRPSAARPMHVSTRLEIYERKSSVWLCEPYYRS